MSNHWLQSSAQWGAGLTNNLSCARGRLAWPTLNWWVSEGQLRPHVLFEGELRIIACGGSDKLLRYSGAKGYSARCKTRGDRGTWEGTVRGSGRGYGRGEGNGSWRV